MNRKEFGYSYMEKRSRNKKASKIFLICFSIFMGITLFLNFILFSVKNESISMESGISQNGVVLVCPFLKTPDRGSVVYLDRMDNTSFKWYQKAVDRIVEYFTLRQYAPFSSSSMITGNSSIRRVVGLPGDTVYMKDYILFVKPRNENLFLTEYELSKKDYNLKIFSTPAEWDSIGLCGEMGETVIGENQYFVLADNRIEGIDSRFYGCVSASKIKGKVLCQLFPFNKIHRF